jgi:uncharacterized membrane protein YeaQ/YmgE (transglycosylase-associated protein family)
VAALANVIGILAGFLAGKIVKGHGMGTLMDLLVGIVGSVLGGWIFTLLGLAAYGLIGQLVLTWATSPELPSAERISSTLRRRLWADLGHAPSLF